MNHNKKPIVSWYKNFDPTIDYSWVNLLTEVNIINTKKFTKEFLDICLSNKHRIFLHVYINGMGQTPFEPNIQTVKYMFEGLKYLVNNGFPIKQILVCINPILPNDNGLKAMKLLLRVLTEYKELRLRWVRTQILSYKDVSDLTSEFKSNSLKIKNQYKFGGKSVISNDNILKRISELKPLYQYLFKTESFYKEYYKVLDQYKSIINIDSGDEYSIGVRELTAFGYNNIWVNSDGSKDKIIKYENNNKFKPIVNIISRGGSKTFRCKNRCKLCPYLN